jgi:hypothetical protein
VFLSAPAPTPPQRAALALLLGVSFSWSWAAVVVLFGLIPALALFFPPRGAGRSSPPSTLTDADLERIIDEFDDDIATFLGRVFERWCATRDGDVR